MSIVAPHRITAPVAAEDRAVHLFGLLHGVSRWQMFQAAARTLLLAAAVLLAAALLALLTDAVFGLPPLLRILIDVVLGLSAVLAAAAVIRGCWRLRFDPRRAARDVECRLHVPDSVLINAVEFAAAPPATDSPVLRERVVRMAEERARNLSAVEVVSFRPIGRALGWGAIVAAAAVVISLAAPRMVGMVLPRYLDPLGDHPPFTLTTFDVAVDPTPVDHGRHAIITAVLGGPESIARADVVLLPEPAKDEAPAVAEQRTPMFRSGDDTFVLELEQVERSRRFYIDTPSGRSPTQSLTVAAVPIIEEATVHYEYPAYTGWPPQEQRLSAAGIRGLAGTEAALTVRSNLPLAAGRWELTTSAASPTPVLLTPTPADPRTATVRVRLERSGSFALTLQAKQGGWSREPLTGSLQVVADQPPRVAIVEPQPHVVVVENWSVPVVVEAADDVGLAGLRLSRSINGWGPATIDLVRETLRSGVVQGTAEFDLAELGARAGDVIEFYATAADNHPQPAQFTDTPTHVIQVISQADYIQLARQQYQLDDLAAEFDAIQERLDALQREREEALRRLDELQQQLAQSPDGAQSQESLRETQQQLEKLTASSAALAQQLQERAEQLPLYDVEQPYTEGLKKLAEQLEQQSQAAQQAADAVRQMQSEGATPERQQQLADAADRLRKQQGGLDEAAREQRQATQQDLELLQQADRLLAQAERLRSIIPQQRDLATRLGEFQNQPSLSADEQERADQLAKQQERLEQELQEVARELESAADAAAPRLPQMSHSARQIAESIREQEIPGDQQQAAEQARQGAGREAHERATSAATKLESLAGQCPNCQGAAGELAGELDGPLSLSQPGLQRSLEQLAQGRSLPGLPRPGEGQGQGDGTSSGAAGASGQSGQPQGGTGQNARWRPGQSFPGSQARTPILGPRTLVEERPRPQPGGQLGGNERGSFAPGSSGGELSDAESLTPESREFRGRSSGNLRGVPVPYRKDAEAYFQRLAEDEAAK